MLPCPVWLSLAKQKAAGSITSQGTCLGCGFGPQTGHIQEVTVNVSLSHWNFSPSLSPLLLLSLKYTHTHTHTHKQAHINTNSQTHFASTHISEPHLRMLGLPALALWAFQFPRHHWQYCALPGQYSWDSIFVFLSPCLIYWLHC